MSATSNWACVELNYFRAEKLVAVTVKFTSACIHGSRRNRSDRTWRRTWTKQFPLRRQGKTSTGFIAH
jgi:hypothetical protein